MMAGGGLNLRLTFNELLLAMILGEYFLMYHRRSSECNHIKQAFTFALFDATASVRKALELPLFSSIVNLGWYTIQAALYGHFIAQVFNLSYTGEIIAMMLSAVIMGIFAVLGIKSLAVFGYIAIPSIVFLS